MKVLYPIIDGEISGGNMICLRFIEAAQKKGWDVFVNSPGGGDFIEMIRNKCAGIYHVDTTRSFRLDKSVKLAKIIKAEKINVVHSHTPLPGTNISRIAATLAGVPVITHAHSLGQALNSNLAIKKYQLMLDWATSRFFCDRIIAVAEAVKTATVQRGSPPSKIEVIYNGIALTNNRSARSPEEVRKEFNLTENQKLVGQVGYFCRNKGQHVLIKAACSAIKDFPDAIFMIVGADLQESGKYKKKLENLARELGVEKNIIFTGYRSDVRDLMSAFDAFVLPSFAEGLPVTILEAMAARKPVITTSVGGNAEIVVHEETGMIVPAGDHQQLSEAILHLLHNPEKAALMGQKGYERVQAYFSLEQMVERTFQVYKEVMAK